MNKLTAKIAMSSLFAILSLILSRSVSAEDKKQIGQRLLDNAQKLSDIRAEGSAAFRMEAAFRITEKSKKATTGQYTEIWISKVKWRREVEAGSSHNVEIAVGASKWSSNLNNSAEPNFHRALTLLFAGTSHEALEVKGASELQVGSVRAICVRSKSECWKNIDCIDPGSGTFLRRETTDKSRTSISCNYWNYEKFGDRMFPRSIQCAEDAGKGVELTISRITLETAPEESSFVPPPDAIETANCTSRAEAPRLIDDPEPKYPDHHREEVTVILSTVISREGQPQHVRVTNTGGPDFDPSAVQAIQRWRFEPSKCDGVSVPALISIQVHFRHY